MEHSVKKVRPEDFTRNPFDLIGKQWLLLAAEKDGKTNAMTCSWGGLGVLWRKNVAFIFVRKSRYTKEFMDAAEMFSLSFFDDPGHKMLSYFGKVSGRDEDKIAKAGLTMTEYEGAPCFEQAQITMVCRKLYAQDQNPELFSDKSILDSCYGDNDYHCMFVGEILEILEK